MRRSFVLKVALNYGKQYGELPKEIPCNILKCNYYSSFMFAYVCVDCEIVPFFPRSRQSQNDTRSATLPIPFWYINAHKHNLSPHGFPLVEFQLWTRQKRSRDVRHTWPALSKNP